MNLQASLSYLLCVSSEYYFILSSKIGVTKPDWNLYIIVSYCVFIKVICILMMKEIVFIASGELLYDNFSQIQQGQSFKLEKNHKLPFPIVVVSRIIYMYLEYKPKQLKFLTKETMLYLRTCIFIHLIEKTRGLTNLINTCIYIVFIKIFFIWHSRYIVLQVVHVITCNLSS